MAVAVLLLMASAAFAQDTADGLPLLRAVAASFDKVTSYRVEGHVSSDLDFGGRMKDEYEFQIFSQPPRARIRIVDQPPWSSQPSDASSICNENESWLYREMSHTYSKTERGPEGALNSCDPGSLVGFAQVADNVKSARIVGKRNLPFEGAPHQCTVVEAHYRVIKNFLLLPGMVTHLARATRTICVDQQSKLILSDRFESGGGPPFTHIVVAVTYSRIERDPSFPPATFEFHPPEDSSEQRPLQPPPLAPNAAPPQTATITRAEPIRKEDPEYTQEAWDEGIEGSIQMDVEIGPDGAILGVHPNESLGWGLDEQAIECVRRWIFQPATDHGKPVKGFAWVMIKFILPDQRPEHASSGPLTRTEPPVLLPESELKFPSDLDNFNHVIGVNFGEPEFCERIDPLAQGGGSHVPGHMVERLQSQCYQDLAARLNDPKFCEFVKPVRTAHFDGSLMNKDYCVHNMILQTEVGPDPHSDAFARFVQQMGYDAQVAKFHEQEHRRGPVQRDDYWWFVFDLSFSKDRTTRAEFLRRALNVK